MTIKDRVPICGGFLNIVGDPRFVEYDGKGHWLFHRERYRELMTRCADGGMSIVRKGLTVPYYSPLDVEHLFSPFGTRGQSFDLLAENEWYWPLMLAMQEVDRRVGVLARYDIIGGCDHHPGTWNRFVPWMNNVQGIKAAYDKAAWPVVRALAVKAVKTLGRDNFFAVGNEVDKPEFLDVFLNVFVPLLKDGTFEMARFCYGSTMPEARFVNPPVMENDNLTYYPKPVRQGTQGAMKDKAGDLLGEKAKVLIYRDVHKFGSPPYDAVRKDGALVHQVMEMWCGPIAKWCGTDGKKLDPRDPRASKCDVASDGARISGETWEAMILRALGVCRPEVQGLRQRIIFEHCPQAEGDALCLSNTIRHMSRGIERAGYGISENRGQYPWKPSNEPDPMFPPEPPDPEYIEVTICKATGLIANAYCPEPYTMLFDTGTEPVAVCAAHAKPPPAPECSCSAWLDTEGGKRKADWARWISCLFGGKKRCR